MFGAWREKEFQEISLLVLAYLAYLGGGALTTKPCKNYLL